MRSGKAVMRRRTRSQFLRVATSRLGVWAVLALSGVGCAQDAEDVPADLSVSDAVTAPDGALVDQGFDAGLAADAAADAFTEPDLGPDATPPPVDPPRSVSPTRVVEGTVYAAARVTDGIIVDADDGVSLMRPDGPMLLGTELGRLNAVAEFRRGHPLLSAENGIFSWDRQRLARSPLSDSVEGVQALFAAPGPAGRDLWIRSDAGIDLYRDGLLSSVHPRGLSTAVSQFAVAPWPDGVAGIWMLTPEEVYAVSVDAEGLTAWPSGLEGPFTALAADGPGAVWTIANGTLHRRAGDGSWSAFDTLPFTPTMLSAAPDAADLWLAGEDGSLWHQRAGRFSRIEDAPEFEHMGPDGAGGVLLWGASGLHVATPGAFLAVSGVSDGASLSAVTPVRLRATPEAGLERLTVSLDDGAPQEISGPPYTWFVDPEQIEDGSHRAVFTAQWAESQAQASLRFSTRLIGPPTWRDDISPLFLDRCENCHGERGFARHLDTPGAWQAEIDTILRSVSLGNMPLPPTPVLTAEEVQLIEAWRDAEFPEEWP